jgi:putative SOS response-associated peptidase YedK
MCGRYAITTAPEAMRRLFGYREQPNFPARYNVAPTQPIPIVRLESGKRRFALVRWGLLPAWVKDPKAFTLVINGRADSVLDKPAFRYAMRRRRCLIPADGFYEWKGEGAAKRPYFVKLKSGEPFAFAGLWECWTGPNGEEMETAALLTTEANRALAEIHHRMPVMLLPDAFASWLDCVNVDGEMAAAMLTALPDEAVEAHPVSHAVNKVVNDDASLIEPVAEDAPLPVPPKAARRKPAEDDKQPSLF